MHYYTLRSKKIGAIQLRSVFTNYNDRGSTDTTVHAYLPARHSYKTITTNRTKSFHLQQISTVAMHTIVKMWFLLNTSRITTYCFLHYSKNDNKNINMSQLRQTARCVNVSILCASSSTMTHWPCSVSLYLMTQSWKHREMRQLLYSTLSRLAMLRRAGRGYEIVCRLSVWDVEICFSHRLDFGILRK